MEEGKKKRWRPSLAQYRELERRIDEQIDGTSLIVADCHGWRAKYRNLIDEISKGNDKKVLRDHIEALECENETLRHSNKLMETELKRVNGLLDWSKKVSNELLEELIFLKNRGFWARLFNKNE